MPLAKAKNKLFKFMTLALLASIQPLFAQETPAEPTKAPPITSLENTESKVDVNDPHYLSEEDLKKLAEAQAKAEAKEKAQSQPSAEQATTSTNSPIPTDNETQTQEEGFAFSSGGVAVGVLTLDGLTWSRISWRPELSIGKLGVVFDLELFINSQGQFSSRGWEFDTQEEVLNTLYRKIYYMRWAQPGDPLYIRVGALEDLNLDVGGLITNSYGNVALYPGIKSLGIHLQLNQMGSMDWSFEALTNSIEDWQNGGGVLGLRSSFAPIASLPIPIINDFRIGATWVKDFNQFAAIPDRDNDGCPDRLDDSPNDKSSCVSYVDTQRMRENGVDQEIIDQVSDLVEPAEARETNRIRGDFEKTRPFAVMGLDALLPLIQSDLLAWRIYTAAAFPLDDDLKIADSFGTIPLGSSMEVFIFDLGLEYRYFQNYFNAAHFDAFYDMDRVKFEDNAYLTKSQQVWGVDRGRRHGIHGWVGADLGGIVNLGASYTHLFTELRGVEDDKAYTAQASLGEFVLNLIPKLSSAVVFYEKDRVGQGLNDDGNDDDFFELSTNSRYGYKIGVTLGEGMTLVIGSLVSYEYLDNAGLESRTNFTAETIFSF